MALLNVPEVFGGVKACGIVLKVTELRLVEVSGLGVEFSVGLSTEGWSGSSCAMGTYGSMISSWAKRLLHSMILRSLFDSRNVFKSMELLRVIVLPLALHLVIEAILGQILLLGMLWFVAALQVFITCKTVIFILL